jgi:hypothetical protein
MVAIGGTMPQALNPHNVMILANGKHYVHHVLDDDSTTSIAKSLAMQASGDIPGTFSAGAWVIFPSGTRIGAARVGITGTLLREVKRQNRAFQVVTWANTPENRDIIADAMDIELCANQFLVLPDTTAARIIYRGTFVTDDYQKALLYRRDLFYNIEYATTQITEAIQVTQETHTYAPIDPPGQPPVTIINS